MIKSIKMNPEIISYNKKQQSDVTSICNALANLIDNELEESKVWHAHPVWFIDGNPIVGYSKQKQGIRLMFWSGADFDEENLIPGTGKFKDASIYYTSVSQINTKEIKRWLKKAKTIQWDYKKLIKRKGKLEKIETVKKTKGTLHICPNGHRYYKSSDCPTCPQCEAGKRPTTGFLSLLYAPARRALENAGIKTLQQLSTYSKAEILNLHGIGKTSLPVLSSALKIAGLSFRKK